MTQQTQASMFDALKKAAEKAGDTVILSAAAANVTDDELMAPEGVELLIVGVTRTKIEGGPSPKPMEVWHAFGRGKQSGRLVQRTIRGRAQLSRDLLYHAADRGLVFQNVKSPDDVAAMPGYEGAWVLVRKDGLDLAGLFAQVWIDRTKGRMVGQGRGYVYKMNAGDVLVAQARAAYPELTHVSIGDAVAALPFDEGDDEGDGRETQRVAAGDVGDAREVLDTSAAPAKGAAPAKAPAHPPGTGKLPRGAGRAGAGGPTRARLAHPPHSTQARRSGGVGVVRSRLSEAAEDAVCVACGAPASPGLTGATGDSPARCEACARQGERLMADGAMPRGSWGLTACCRVLALRAPKRGGKKRRPGDDLPGVAGPSYCPRCPGAGKVAVVLIYQGEERTVYHPPQVWVTPGGGRGRHAPQGSDRDTKGGPLAACARRLGVGVDELVLETGDARSFRLGSLRAVDPSCLERRRRAPGRPVVLVVEACRRCGKRGERHLTRTPTRPVLYCDACANDRVWAGEHAFAAGRARKTAALRAEVNERMGPCEWGHHRSRNPDGSCRACELLADANGECERCMRPRVRVRAQNGGDAILACPDCEEPLTRTGRRSVRVELVDAAGRTGAVYRPQDARVGAHLAGQYVGLKVHVRDVRSSRLNLGSAQVVAGLLVPGTGPSVRAFLPLLRAARGPGDAVAILERGGWTAAEAAGSVAQLVQRGLLSPRGLTGVAREVLAYADAHGVRL